MPLASATKPSTAAAMPAMPKAKPKKIPAIMPTRPGTSSWAKTTIAGKADERMKPMKTVRHAGPEQVGVGHDQREGQDAEDREPDDGLGADLVADRAAEHSADGCGAEEQEQHHLLTAAPVMPNLWMT